MALVLVLKTTQPLLNSSGSSHEASIEWRTTAADTHMYMSH